jgi:hypothetical protein
MVTRALSSTRSGSASGATGRSRACGGEPTGDPEAAVDANRQAAPLEQRQPGQHARDRPAGGRDELVDGRSTEDKLAPEPAGGLADIGQRRRNVTGDARLRQVVGQAQVVDELGDARDDPGIGELA